MTQKGIKHRTNTVAVQAPLVCETGWDQVQTSDLLPLARALEYVLLVRVQHVPLVLFGVITILEP